MKALLLLGGLGMRLRPFTLETPKSLLPGCNIPLVWYQFALLKKYGIEEIILGVGYKNSDFKQVVSLGKKMGLKITLSVEDKALGTGGGIRNAYKYFSKKEEPLIIFNGDILSNFNLQKILDYHNEKDADVTIGLVKVVNPSAYGLVIMDEEMKIKKFIEKPSSQEIISDTVNAGVYLLKSSEFLKEIPENQEVSIEREIFPLWLTQDKSLFGYVHHGYWLDIGTIDSYLKANFDVLSGKFNPECSLECGENNPVYKNISVEGKLVLGKDAYVGKNTVIKGSVIIGENCFVGENCLLKDTIILDNSAVKKESTINNSVIGKEVYIGESSTLENIVLADKSFIKHYTHIKTLK